MSPAPPRVSGAGVPNAKERHWHDLQDVLLDALFALGEYETDFEWADEIPVHRIEKSVLDRYHAWLKPKRKPRNAYDLHHPFEIDDYCLFTPAALLETIRRDERFVVEGNDYWSSIRLAR